MSIEEIMSKKRLIDDEINDITNDLSYKRFRDAGKRKGVLMEEKYLAASQRIKSICNDEDDSIPLRDIIARYSSSVAITSSPPVLPTREPEDSLIMGDEHLDTIPEKESDELIKSSVENLVPIPSESEDFSENEKELNLEIVDTIFESLSLSPILVEDSDSLMEEIGLFLASDDSMPSGIEDDDYDSEGDIHFLEELLNNDSLLLPENESSNLDHFNVQSPSRSSSDTTDSC
ncbi:hypothetical protein Tco_0822158 [Tanacetum coccineum]|uniref:Uncharacterized protein n=1 Tax=Tanacetum coccineum TaxID=301880 RepID=A0ABQ5AIR0_9ASTR